MPPLLFPLLPLFIFPSSPFPFPLYPLSLSLLFVIPFSAALWIALKPRSCSIFLEISQRFVISSAAPVSLFEASTLNRKSLPFILSNVLST